MNAVIVATLLCSCLVGCVPSWHATNAVNKSNAASRWTDESDIRIVVCEYLIEHENKLPPSYLIFAGLDREELKVLRRNLQGREVLQASAAVETPGVGIVDKLSKKRGALVMVNLRHIAGDQAEARGVIATGASSLYAVELLRTDKWQVRKCELIGVGD